MSLPAYGIDDMVNEFAHRGLILLVTSNRKP